MSFLNELFGSTKLLGDPAVTTEAATQQPSMLESMIPFSILLILAYFLIIRPQSKKLKDQQTLISGLTAGDEVVTSGGIMGKVKSVQNDHILLDLGSTVIKVLKEHISVAAKKSTPDKT